MDKKVLCFAVHLAALGLMIGLLEKNGTEFQIYSSIDAAVGYFIVRLVWQMLLGRNDKDRREAGNRFIADPVNQKAFALSLHECILFGVAVYLYQAIQRDITWQAIPILVFFGALFFITGTMVRRDIVNWKG